MLINVITHECLQLEYKGGEHILVPVTQLHKISKYRCHDDTQPVLDKVGSKKWQNPPPYSSGKKFFKTFLRPKYEGKTQNF